MQSDDHGMALLTITPMTLTPSAIPHSTNITPKDIPYYARKAIKAVKRLQKRQDCCFAEGYKFKNGMRYGPYDASREIKELMIRIIVSPPTYARKFCDEAMDAIEYIRECHDGNFQRGAEDALWDIRKAINKILKLV